MDILKMGEVAKLAAKELALKTAEEKSKALNMAAEALIEHSDDIIKANEIDIKNGKEKGLSASLIDRLMLNGDRIKAIANSLKEIANEEDPVGKILESDIRPNRLKINKISVPLGVVGIIYEARPNVTADAAAICLKSGNAAILRGGKEAINSNIAIAKVLNDAFISAGLPNGTIQLITDTSRESATALMNLRALSVIIPRGGAALIKHTLENSKVPVIETGTGNCHCFVDSTADLNMAKKIVVNAKCSRPSVCNALETLLVEENIAKEFLPLCYEGLKEYNCKILGCAKTVEILSDATLASEEDYMYEALDYSLSIKVVKNTDEAIAHIQKYSSGHSECIVTESHENAGKFIKQIDSAAVYVNASTRFTDGGEFGFGAEIGISTQKMHVRGPMGAKHLVSFKYVILGEGQTR